ncbi:MAG: hypothetical protein ACE5PT_13895 [Gemmatimonadales bacterium]
MHSARELDSLLRERAGIRIEMPELGYFWDEDRVQGNHKAGSVWVVHRRMIYYFIHWGPIETEEVTEQYARERIPAIWPGEGLEVRRTERVAVAGHSAIFAEAVPRRRFYRAYFLIWNCPQTQRQFIADMNYNTRYRTPDWELQAQIDATMKTLVCHREAPISPVPGHSLLYTNPRFNISFAHPSRWYVFESPYRVPHPAYRGVRNQAIGSLLAWPKERYVRLGFVWQPRKAENGTDTAPMLGRPELLQAAVDLMNGLPEVESFRPWAREILTAGDHRAFKVLGSVTWAIPDTAGAAAHGRAAVLVIDDLGVEKRVFVVVEIDDYSVEGRSRPVEREIFDQWTNAILSGLRP